MKTVERPDGTLFVSHDRVRLARCFAVLGACTAIALAGDLFGFWRGGRWGLFAATLSCWLTALALWERAWFVFDPRSSTIDWERRWPWFTRSGSLGFSSVATVLVQSPVGDSGIPSRRVTLKLTDGRELPLTRGFLTDSGDRILMLGGRIRQLIGRGAADPAASVHAFAAAGQSLDAVRLRRQTSDVTLDRAVKDVRERRDGA
jgi:hypothetical protein